ncbi:MAG: hypothetical protein ACLR8R_10135 [Oscillospiraceae bacterium]
MADLHSTDRVLQNRVVRYRGGSPQCPIHDWSEWQADNLASALLLPLEIVHGALRRFDLEHWHRHTEQGVSAKGIRAVLRNGGVPRCFKTGYGHQAERLGLLKKDYLQNPYALADVERRMMIDGSICQYCRQVPGMWLARDGQGIAYHRKN